MEIIGHGIDIVEFECINRILNRSGDHFLSRCFTPIELSACCGDAHRVRYLAGRFAAKEAVLKALGTGWSQGISFLDIEIYRLDTGQPAIQLYAGGKEKATELHVSKWLISISHSESYTVASVIAVG